MTLHTWLLIAEMKKKIFCSKEYQKAKESIKSPFGRTYLIIIVSVGNFNCLFKGKSSSVLIPILA